MGSLEDALQKNFSMGVVAGLQLATRLPEALMELERERFNAILERERDGND